MTIEEIADLVRRHGHDNIETDKLNISSLKGSGNSGQVLTSNGIDNPTFEDLPTSEEWTFIETKTFANSSTTQDFTSFAAYDLYKIRFVDIRKTSVGGALRLGIQINNNNGGTNYNVSYIAFNGGTSSGSDSSWSIFFCGAAGQTFYQGEYIISGKAYGVINFKGIWGSGIGGENGGTDTYLLRGTTTDNADLTSVQIITTDAITGSVELWGKNTS
jgi:hypothetical protein